MTLSQLSHLNWLHGFTWPLDVPTTEEKLKRIIAEVHRRIGEILEEEKSNGVTASRG